jgi:hypothetical protein
VGKKKAVEVAKVDSGVSKGALGFVGVEVWILRRIWKIHDHSSVEDESAFSIGWVFKYIL